MYRATFGPGPLGMTLKSVRGHIIVDRLTRPSARTADGGLMQAERLGVKVGHEVVGLVTTHIPPLDDFRLLQFPEVIERLKRASRPLTLQLHERQLCSQVSGLRARGRGRGCREGG